ncbi:hypothetical protein AB0G04_02005 [Actinoplanes sp. NPDC023801]|uniref:hypothetical protein n=1 Tax=Actinoplanes sp. NPDC023801 TaxID=3154595 RepID=UPI0033D4F3A0
MRSRLARPALAAFVGGALLAGGALHGSPAYASPDSSADALTEKPAAESGTADPGAVTLDATDPGTTDPGTTDPGTTDPGTTNPEPPTSEPDTTKPTGSFRINYTSVWAGQQITIGQNASEYSDPVDAQDTLKRVVSWGDGTTTTLGATTFLASKSYTKAGSFKVTVIVTDPAGNQSEIPARTVGVSVPAGKISLSRKSIYQGGSFKVNIDKVPAGATKYRIDWSDGWVSVHNASTRRLTGSVLYQWKWDAAKKKYVRVGNGRLSGVRPIKISWGSSRGYSTFQTGAWINVVKDTWKPTVSITKPSSPSKASSWKTIRGTAKDKGAGLRHVGVTVFRVTSTGKAYCLTPQKKWKRYYNDADVDKYCYATGYKVKVVNGKWSLKLPAGVARNQFIAVDIWAYDWADHFRQTYRTAKLTRS